MSRRRAPETTVSACGNGAPPLFPRALVGSPLVCDRHGRYLTARERARGRCGWCDAEDSARGNNLPSGGAALDADYSAAGRCLPPAPTYHHEPGLSLGRGIRGCCNAYAELVATADGWICRGCGHETPAEP
jgi:hypothetical protein